MSLSTVIRIKGGNLRENVWAFRRDKQNLYTDVRIRRVSVERDSIVLFLRRFSLRLLFLLLSLLLLLLQVNQEKMIRFSDWISERSDQVPVLVKRPFYWKSQKMTEEQQTPTLGVRPFQGGVRRHRQFYASVLGECPSKKEVPWQRWL